MDIKFYVYVGIHLIVFFQLIPKGTYTFIKSDIAAHLNPIEVNRTREIEGPRRLVLFGLGPVHKLFEGAFKLQLVALPAQIND